jgi:NADPH:quinone reductase-like Zn-dependent oxidoreductase
LPYLGLRTGAYADFMAIPEGWPLAKIPEGMEFEQVAGVADGAFCAINAYRPISIEGKDVRVYGASGSIDYLSEDFTKNGKTYDVIFDAVGKHSFRRCKDSLKAGGVYLPTDGVRNLLLWLLHKRFGDKKVLFEMPRFRKDDVLLLPNCLPLVGTSLSSTASTRSRTS